MSGGRCSHAGKLISRNHTKRLSTSLITTSDLLLIYSLPWELNAAVLWLPRCWLFQRCQAVSDVGPAWAKERQRTAVATECQVTCQTHDCGKQRELLCEVGQNRKGKKIKMYAPPSNNYSAGNLLKFNYIYIN